MHRLLSGVVGGALSIAEGEGFSAVTSTLSSALTAQTIADAGPLLLQQTQTDGDAMIVIVWVSILLLNQKPAPFQPL